MLKGGELDTKVQSCTQLRHSNRLVDLNLVPTWHNQYDLNGYPTQARVEPLYITANLHVIN